jgi:hypothetical protein
MADGNPEYVSVGDFVTVVKILSSQINALTVNVMALRAALMQAKELPVPPEELKRLNEFFREFEPIRAAREAVENLTANTSDEIIELLRKYEGPIQ